MIHMSTDRPANSRRNISTRTERRNGPGEVPFLPRSLPTLARTATQQTRKKRSSNPVLSMKTTMKVVASVLGVGTVVLLLADCHHLGGGCSSAPATAPVATAGINSVPSSTPAQPNATAGHQH